MLATHREGRGVVGRFPAPLAKAKVENVWARAKAAHHPLWCSVEIDA